MSGVNTGGSGSPRRKSWEERYREARRGKFPDGAFEESRDSVESRYSYQRVVWERLIENVEGVDEAGIARFISEGPKGVGSQKRAKVIVTERPLVKREAGGYDESEEKRIREYLREVEEIDPDEFRWELLDLTNEEEVRKLAPRDPSKAPITSDTKLYKDARFLSERADSSGREEKVLGQPHYRFRPPSMDRDEAKDIRFKDLYNDGIIGSYPTGRSVPYTERHIYMRKDMVEKITEEVS